ncbi:hypothetical protein [Streptococcus acidominimus]|uniref:Uncharacterized protein n=2 Tax=Streptococcus acidominimus TaxID=1326 RepID=A0A1Q8E717_STRAI|nr:hypothetical protein BU200_10185 [Streptococcus acidominimus]SUN08240.1 Uncharacterised protein [Streptococcus acidominimus]
MNLFCTILKLNNYMIDFASILATAGVSSTSKPTLIPILVWLFVMLVGFILIRPKQIQRMMEESIWS